MAEYKIMDKDDAIRTMSYNDENYDTLSFGEKSRLIFHKEKGVKLYWKKYPMKLNDVVYKYQIAKFEDSSISIPMQYFLYPINDEEFYSIEEYIEGQTLREFLDANKTLEIWDIEVIIYKLVETVQLLSYDNIVHRDIKPENIIIDEYGYPTLIDFDISREASVNNSKARDTEILGTLGYSAPEQYGGGETGTYSDIYSLGVVLQEMLDKLDDTYDESEIDEHLEYYETSGKEYEYDSNGYESLDHVMKAKYLRDVSHRMTDFAIARRIDIDELFEYCDEYLFVY